MPKSKPRAGRFIGRFQIIDAKGILRTLPSKEQARARFLAGVERKRRAKAQAATPEGPPIPKTLPRETVLRILGRMGFEECGAAPQRFSHPKYGVVHIPMGRGLRTGKVSIRRSFWRRIIGDYLKQGGKL